ncbi:MAG: LysM peptidoglycan-binding domain-containing protein [Cellvibrionales bacterium TMED148]|nr:lytic murein transglycosylase [Porticoccaceae bacterium]RPG94006.1 MAG: LysM peptidoglycan-binding domain-containing protein [Cellvibrionales bacterium TMED148]
MRLSIPKTQNFHQLWFLCLLPALTNCGFAETSSITFAPTSLTAHVNKSSEKIVKIKSKRHDLEQTLQLPIWHRIRNGYQLLPKNLPPRVSDFRRAYLGRQEYLSIVLERSRPFLFYITEQLKLSDLPLEIALLPIIESGYDPFAYSKSHAAGLWQFIPSTGEYFGLEKNYWYDGRLDLVESTRAAIEYLRYLHNHFNNDWLLALAAYNAGEGFINKRIKENLKRGLSTDFWSLKLPRQTREYVPRLLAIADIIKNPQHYAVSLPHIPNRPFFDMILIEDQIEVSEILQKGELSTKNFSALNAGILESITPPLKKYYLLVPTHKGTVVRDFLQASRKETWRARSKYSVVYGDTLSEIAQKHNVTLDWLKKVNNWKTDHLSIGDTLLVPNKSRFSNEQKQVEKHLVLYRVAAGDSLSKLSDRFDMNLNKLKSINKLRTDLIRVGQILKVQSQRIDSYPPSPRHIYYNIKSGDTLSRIAIKYGTTVEQIINWNNIQNSQQIHPGETLFIKSE